ncbi:hypothetical protein [Sorangium sp. So ce381]|uniref:hypothetical protein n=1 Tax=Sorangium sp. So ce381 TaxID=3133307 RepID=UPI003F5C4D16
MIRVGSRRARRRRVDIVHGEHDAQVAEGLMPIAARAQREAEALRALIVRG